MRKIGEAAQKVRREKIRGAHKVEMSARRQRQNEREPDPTPPQPKRLPNRPADKAVEERIIESAKARRLRRGQDALYNQMQQQEGHRA